MLRNRAVTWSIVLLALAWIGLAEPSQTLAYTASAAGGESRPAPASEGVVVESVGKGSALEKAGVQPGDVLHSWRRLPSPPANPDEASGEFVSPFDWWEVEIEQAQRGRLLLSGNRDGSRLTFEIDFGDWSTTVRPRLRPQTLDSYLKISASLRSESAARALSSWSVLERKLKESPGSAEHGWLSYWFASEVLHRGHSDKSFSLVSSMLQLDLDLSMRAVLLELASEILEQQGKPREAEERLLEALRIRISQGSRLAEALTHSRLGTFYLYQGQWEQAEAHYEAAMALRARHAPGSMDFAASLNNLGILALEREDFEAALQYFRQALELRSAFASGSSSEGESLYNVGIIYGKLDAEDLSEEYLRRALRLFEQVDPRSLRLAMTMNCLGISYLDRQDLDLARFYLGEALEILMDVAPESLDTADTLTNLGHIFFQERDFVEAERHFSKALRIQKKLTPGGGGVARSLNNLGITLGEKGPFSEALAAHQEALGVLEGISPQGAEVASNLYNIGVLYAERKNSSKAIEFLSRSLALRERLLPDSHILAETYAALGKLALEDNDLSAADGWYAKAMRVFERQILFLGSARAGTVPLRTSREEIYRGALAVASQRGDAKAVLEALERFRGIQLAEMISHRERDVLAHLPEDVGAQLRGFQKEYEEKSLALEALTGDAVMSKSGALKASLSELQRRYSETIESVRARGESAIALRYPRQMTSSDLTDSLPPGQGLLYFYVIDQEIWSLLVLRNQPMKIRRHSLSASAIEAKVELLRSLIRSEHGSTALRASRSAAQKRVAKELYEVLVGPVEADLASLPRLLLVPDGILQILPWGSLIRGYGRGDEARPQYLAEWRSFHLVLSASVYLELQKRGLGSSEIGPELSLLAFGDPDYAAGELNQQARGRADLRAESKLWWSSGRWQPLLFSRREVEGIARLFPPDRIQLFLGENATEERAKTLGKDARIIHFATHAHLDDRFPLNSALALSMPKSLLEDREENGLLQVWEIFARIRWHADLVVLSGCETALGEEQGGEGLLGLTRAFQYAGARSVLASLWKVQDQATSELMIRFYKHLRVGLPKDQALQAAQQEFIRGPIEITNEKGEREIRDFTAPYYWAGFQLYGDWQ